MNINSKQNDRDFWKKLKKKMKLFEFILIKHYFIFIHFKDLKRLNLNQQIIFRLLNQKKRLIYNFKNIKNRLYKKNIKIYLDIIFWNLNFQYIYLKKLKKKKIDSIFLSI